MVTRERSPTRHPRFSPLNTRYHKTVPLNWQSKLVLLLVLPALAAAVVLDAAAWSTTAPPVALWTLGLSALLGLLAWLARSGTPAAAATGALLTAGMMFSTAELPFHLWQTALIPVIVLLLLTSLATRFGRARKQRLGTAEATHGRIASQVSANLGLAALVATPAAHLWLVDTFSIHYAPGTPFFTVALAALAEAAADTISSEIGQVLGGRPWMLTTLQRVDPGTDGAISLSGTAAGIIAAGAVSAAGTWALRGGAPMLAASWTAGLFGLFFDSLLGATLERKGWLNNDAVNFLSTASAAAFALALIASVPPAR